MDFQKSEILKNAVSESWCTDSSWLRPPTNQTCTVQTSQKCSQIIQDRIELTPTAILILNSCTGVTPNDIISPGILPACRPLLSERTPGRARECEKICLTKLGKFVKWRENKTNTVVLSSVFLLFNLKM